MTAIKTIEEMAPADYQQMGLKSGLEIHQQLDTKKKLFCHCPVLPYSDQVHAEILRHMRPTLSELGEYDGTALMEFKTKKEIIYQINKNSVCTYEMDDTPPFELNREALDIGLEISMLLNCNLVSEVHIARKQYLDGSIPTGFQRTTILGVDGWIPYRKRRIGIIQLGLEEDACREVEDKGHTRKFKTDRLGIPLVETVTYPHMKTPSEVAEVAESIRWLTRSTGKVRRGYGSARQDVNVSVKGGRRIEIKGVPRIPLIPRLVHNEAFRQLRLLGISDELSNRGIKISNFQANTYEISDLLKDTQYPPVARILKKGHVVKCVIIKGYRGILSKEIQPSTTFSREFSDRVRVIACLDTLPNIVHSEMNEGTLSPEEWDNIEQNTDMEDNDVAVVVWGNSTDAETATKEISIRAKEALEGVPNETRQAFHDGTNGFERILPGPNRMYPDTDLPPIAISDEKIEKIRVSLPEPPYQRKKRYKALGLSEDLAWIMSISKYDALFDDAVKIETYNPVFLANFILTKLRGLIKGGKLPNFSKKRFIDSLRNAGEKNLHEEALHLLIGMTCGTAKVKPSVASKSLTPLKLAEQRQKIEKILERINTPHLPSDKLKRHLMKYVMQKWRGRMRGSELSTLVEEFVSTRM